MKEFLLLIRNEPDHWDTMTAEQQQLHIREVSNYIKVLTSQRKIKDAQPLSMNGLMLQKSGGQFKDGPFIESKEIIGGYFIIFSEDLAGAVEIAKAYPVFEHGNSRIEIREIPKVEGIN
jgi:hypothetical protein